MVFPARNFQIKSLTNNRVSRKPAKTRELSRFDFAFLIFLSLQERIFKTHMCVSFVLNRHRAIPTFLIERRNASFENLSEKTTRKDFVKNKTKKNRETIASVY